VVNKNLEAYYDAWDRFIGSWMVIKIKEPSCVYQWRLQAEIAMRADGKPGMSDEEVCFSHSYAFIITSYWLPFRPSLIIC
jgi:pantothenate kinase-related protein Tda10